MDDHFSGNTGGYVQDHPIGIEQLPDATAVLVLGILSIVGAFCYGVFGIILGVIALGLSSRPGRLLRESPERYSSSSVSNYKAGRVCAIIGVCISAFYILVLIVVFFAAIGFS